MALKGTSKIRKPKKMGFDVGPVIPIVDRDYGLIRVTADKTSTPYPRASVAVDVQTLKARLAEHQTQDDNKQSNTSLISGQRQHFQRGSDASEGPSKKKLPSTPYPKKGNAITPKALRKSLDELKTEEVTSVTSYYPNLQSLLKDLNLNGLKESTGLPLTSCLRSKPASMDRVKRQKKVTLLSPPAGESSIKNHQIVESSSSTTSEEIEESTNNFYEQRKKFYQDEFKIAKNGKKMSDQMMAQKPSTVDRRTNSIIVGDKKAAEIIEMFIRSQGLSKGKGDTLTLTGKMISGSHSEAV